MATSISLLRYIVAVADQGSFRKGAQQAAVTQPSLSAAIAQFEQRMHCRLFERSRNGVQLTAAGENVVDAARRALDALAQVEAAAQEAKAPFFGPVRIGVIPTLGPYLLPHIHKPIKDTYPDCDMPISEGTTERLLADVHNNRIDVAILAMLPGMHERFATEALFSEPFLAAMPKGHALNKRRIIKAEELAKEHLLLLEEGHCLRDQALAVCGMQTAAPAQGLAYRATSLETLRQIVAAGHGVTLLPALASLHAVANLTLRPVKGKPNRVIAMVWRPGDSRADAYRLLASPIRRGLPRNVVTPL